MYSKAFAGRDICAARLRAWSSRHFCSCRSICAGPCGQFGILCFKMRLGGLFECNLWSLCSFGFLEGFSLVIDRSIFIECFAWLWIAQYGKWVSFLLSKSPFAENVEVKFSSSFCLCLENFELSWFVCSWPQFEVQWKSEAINDVRAPLVFESGSLAEILKYQFQVFF